MKSGTNPLRKREDVKQRLLFCPEHDVKRLIFHALITGAHCRGQRRKKRNANIRRCEKIS